MSIIAEKAASMIDMLPEQEQELAFEMLKRIVLAWDPNYTKVTPDEAAEIDHAEQQIANGEYSQ